MLVGLVAIGDAQLLAHRGLKACVAAAQSFTQLLVVIYDVELALCLGAYFQPG